MNKLNRNEWFTIFAGIIIIAVVIIFVSWTPQNGETISGTAEMASSTAATASTAAGQNSQTGDQSNQSSQNMTSQSSQSGQSSSGHAGQTGQAPALSTQALGKNISTNPDIQIYDLTVGTGTVAAAGNTVSVTYVGALQDGTVFDASSEHGGQPFSFTLGAGQVISGWDIGVAGMKVGGERRLVISPSLGYGSQAVGPIPANSTLFLMLLCSG